MRRNCRESVYSTIAAGAEREAVHLVQQLAPDAFDSVWTEKCSHAAGLHGTDGRPNGGVDLYFVAPAHVNGLVTTWSRVGGGMKSRDYSLRP